MLHTQNNWRLPTKEEDEAYGLEPANRLTLQREVFKKYARFAKM